MAQAGAAEGRGGQACGSRSGDAARCDAAFGGGSGVGRLPGPPHRRQPARNWNWYEHVFHLNERLVNTAVEIALRHNDVFSLRAEYYERLRVSSLGSEAAQTLAVALGMLVAAGGDLRQTIIGCVNYGRDNDSYASVAGAIAGALHGTSARPIDWRATVEAANPAPDMRALARGLTEVVVKRLRRMRVVAEQVGALCDDC